MYKINIESDKEEVAKFLSLYLNFQEINNLLINLNKSKDDIVKKNDLIMKYSIIMV